MTDRWACPRCLFANNELLPFCEVCDAPRSPSVVAEIRRKSFSMKSAISDRDAATAWKCGKCTFLNDLALGVCEVCDTPQEESGWKCCQCTLFNAIELQICMACEYRKDGANAHAPEWKPRDPRARTEEGSNVAPNSQQVSEWDYDIDAAREQQHDPSQHVSHGRGGMNGENCGDYRERCHADEKPDSLKQAFAMWEDAENGDAEVQVEREEASPPDANLETLMQTEKEHRTASGAPNSLESYNNSQQVAGPDSTLFAGFVSSNRGNLSSVYFRSKPPGGSKYPQINCQYDCSVSTDNLAGAQGEVNVKNRRTHGSSLLSTEDVVPSNNVNHALEDDSTLPSTLLKPEDMGLDFLFMVKDARARRVADIMKARQGLVSAHNSADHRANGKVGHHWVDEVKSHVVGASWDGVLRNGEISVATTAPAPEFPVYYAERPQTGKGTITRITTTRDADRPALQVDNHGPLNGQSGKKHVDPHLCEDQHVSTARNVTATEGTCGICVDGCAHVTQSASVLHHLFSGRCNESVPAHLYTAGAKGGNDPAAMAAHTTPHDPSWGALNSVTEQLSLRGTCRDDSMGASILQLLHSRDPASAHPPVQAKGGPSDMEDKPSMLLTHFLNGKVSKGFHAVNSDRMSSVIAKGATIKKQIDMAPSQNSEPSKGSGNNEHRSSESVRHKGSKGFYHPRKGPAPECPLHKGKGSANSTLDAHTAAPAIRSAHMSNGRGKGAQRKKSEADKSEHVQHRPARDKNGFVSATQHMPRGKTQPHTPTDGRALGEHSRPRSQPHSNCVSMFPVSVSTHGKGAVFNLNGMYVDTHPSGVVTAGPIDYTMYGQCHQGRNVSHLASRTLSDKRMVTHTTEGIPHGQPIMTSLMDTVENQHARANATAAFVVHRPKNAVVMSATAQSQSHDAIGGIAIESTRQSVENARAITSAAHDVEDTEWCAAVDGFQQEALRQHSKRGTLLTFATSPTAAKPIQPGGVDVKNCNNAVGEMAWRDMVEEREDSRDHLNLDWLFDHLDQVEDLAPVPTIPKTSLQAAGYTSAWLTKGPDCPPSANDPVFSPPLASRSYNDCPYLLPVDIEAD